ACWVSVDVRFSSLASGYGPAGVPCACLTVRSAYLASVAVGLLNAGAAGHWIVCGAPTPAITGAVVSITWTTWLAVVLLPQRSVGAHVRVTSSARGHEPGGVAWANVSVRLGSHASVA